MRNIKVFNAIATPEERLDSVNEYFKLGPKNLKDHPRLAKRTHAGNMDTSGSVIDFYPPRKIFEFEGLNWDEHGSVEQERLLKVILTQNADKHGHEVKSDENPEPALVKWLYRASLGLKSEESSGSSVSVDQSMQLPLRDLFFVF